MVYGDDAVVWGYLAVQNGAEQACLVDLLAGGQNHLHVVVAALPAGLVQVYCTQLLHTAHTTSHSINQ